MSDKTTIEWTEATWNPITGCSMVSPGCTNCYAMRLAGTRLQHHPSRKGLTRETTKGPVWTGETRFNEEWLDQPLRWKRPRMIFVCAHSDLFHEKTPDEWIDRVFAVMWAAQWHTFQVLTKRAERMAAYFADPEVWHRVGLVAFDHLKLTEPKKAEILSWAEFAADMHPFLHNVWLGVSVENQEQADKRIPLLLRCPAAVRWLSVEPMLGAVNIEDPGVGEIRGIDWVVLGGESGPGARPMHPEWARSLRDQCQEAGVPFFFKQWGSFIHTSQLSGGLHRRIDAQHNLAGLPEQFWNVGKKAAGRTLDDMEWSEYPERPQ